MPAFDHVVVACGSGGTTAGLAVGMRLSGLAAALHAVNVQHTPDVFYALLEEEAAALGVAPGALGASRDWLTIHDGGGLGYGNTDAAELQTILRVGAASGVLLDHVYAGKALHHFCAHARANPAAFRGSRVLFWHTGGLPGLAAQEAQLLGLLPTPRRFEPRKPPPAP